MLEEQRKGKVSRKLKESHDVRMSADVVSSEKCGKLCWAGNAAQTGGGGVMK
jgi:hypothetical protein